MSDMETAQRAFRLLPNERLLWEGRPKLGIPRDLGWRVPPLLLFAFALISALFAALLRVAELPGTLQSVLVAGYLGLTALAILVAPSFLLDPCRFVITDRRVIWKRGRMTRSIERSGITYARIKWHRTLPRVGHLELVRAIPFGPLSRRQRIVLHDLVAPDAVLAILRGASESPHGGDATIGLTDRLDPDEEVLWGAGPEGYLVGIRDVLTSVLGIALLAVGLRYGMVAVGILVRLEELGLMPGSWTWLFLSSAMTLTAVVIVWLGVGLAWHGIWRARAMGKDTEYVLTSRRLLIRRGRVELSVDRAHIVDLTEAPSFRGVSHLYLVLDGPGARALSDSGATKLLPPSRDSVPPVLYELRDAHGLRALLFGQGANKTHHSMT